MNTSATSTGETLRAAAVLLGQLARAGEPIGGRTTYRVGGPAGLFVEVDNEEDLANLVAAISATGIEVLVLGKGSNLLIADGGFPGLCVTLGGEFAELELEAGDGRAEAGGALAYPVLARRSAAAGLAGMEWAVGVPGSVGGGVRMNAGGHGAQTADRLVSARIVALDSGEDRRLAISELDLGYRHSAIGPFDVVVSATYRLDPGDAAASGQLIDEIVRWRRANQPGGRNAGSVFTNPDGDSAGRLIEAAGLKGYRRASARVSEKHANFILVDEDGTADDVYRLIREVQEQVARRLGVDLVAEVRLIGFEP